MPTPPDFTAGTALAAASLNKIGLWEITSATVGTSVSSVTVANAFSSSFDSYKILYTGGTQSADSNIKMRLGSTTTGYYGAYIYAFYSSAGPNVAGDNNATEWTFAGGGASNSALVHVDIHNPFAAYRTRMTAHNVLYSTITGTYTGVLADSTSYTAFTIIPNGTLTGGTITVYGYGKV